MTLYLVEILIIYSGCAQTLNHKSLSLLVHVDIGEAKLDHFNTFMEDAKDVCNI